MNFHIGCAVWAYDEWVGEFYPAGTPKKEYLERYVERMTAVEGNTCFYAVPSIERVEAWADKMPTDFQFCPKLHRSITHEGLLLDKKKRAAQFIQPMKAFGASLGPFHLQLPPSYGPDNFEDLRRFLKAWPRTKGPIAVEVRHPRWFDQPHTDRLEVMLRNLGVARVLLDTRPVYQKPGDPQSLSDRQKPELPVRPHVTADFTFIRYIGHPDARHNDTYLERWADHIADWLERGTRVYFFAHCPDERYSPRIARRMQRLLEERGAPVPPLPWDTLPPEPSQEDLL